MDRESENATARGPKTRTQRDGSKCPPNTYLRYSEQARDYVYYTKIKISGIADDRNTGILESAPDSRERATACVQERTCELLERVQRAAEEHAREQERERALTGNIVITDASLRTVGNITLLELNRYKRKNGEASPHYSTVEYRLALLCAYFSETRDVSTLTRNDIYAYIDERRRPNARGNIPTWGTIRRELSCLKRGVSEANKEGIFDPPLVLPIDSEELTSMVRQDGENERQRSHQYTEDDCKHWLASAIGTRLEHFVYVAYRTGMRSEELQQLRWSWVRRTPAHVQGPYALIRLPEYLYKKTRLDSRPIPIGERLYTYLETLASGKGPNDKLLGRLHNASDLARAVGRKAKRTFVSCDQEPYESAYMTLRDLRASAGLRIYLGHGLEAAQTFLRHRDINMTRKHYVRPSSMEAVNIARTMDELG